MDQREQTLDEQQLRTLSTGELVRHALEEAKLLAKAEILHAKQEIRNEIHEAKLAAIFLGVAGVTAVCGLSVLFVALALALPLSPAFAAAVVGLGLLLVTAGAAAYGVKSLPKKPLPKTQERLKQDLRIAREQLQ